MIGASLFQSLHQIGPTNLKCSRANIQNDPLTKRILDL